jgi:endonuclease/exonuclease/phosphatase family metal-dependent hydrolase
MLRSRLLAVPLTALLGVALLPTTAEAAPAVSSAATASAAVASSSAASKKIVRVATFNVRTARATGDKRSWLKRAPDVAREILSRKPGIVALQELGPGRADGRKGTLKGHTRQTTSLTNTLKRLGGGRYKLVRQTSYFPSGTKHGTQGARILYDSSRFTLKTYCPETTGKKGYNRSCAFDLPLAPGDSRNNLRSAAYAEFADRSTGHRFFVVSAHLDHRHSGSNKTEAKYNRLRASQARAVANKMARVNPKRRPVVFGGDINSWRTDRSKYAPFRALVAKGYRDASSASSRVNYAYPTVNHFDVKLRKSKSGVGPRLDVLMVKGLKAAKRYENVMSAVDRTRPSDHNMGVADILL